MGSRRQHRAWTGWAAAACLMAVGMPQKALAFDDPAVRVARLSYLAGGVSVERADNTGKDVGQVNMPLPEGSRVVTAGKGEAEIEFEDGSLVRLTPNSAVTLTSLGLDGGGNYLTRLDVVRGLVYAELRATTKYSYLLGAGADALSPVTNATVRILLDEPPPLIAVLDGSVHVASGLDSGAAGFQTTLQAGQSLTNDLKDGSRYYQSEGVAKESWDAWNEDRDQAAANEASTRTVARDGFAGDQGYGWSDLDANGSWYDVPGQGQVWQPSVAAGLSAGFDPYGYGSWVWYPVSGYVWSSGYSWGWTPFRCGNWSYFNSFGWGWAPGSSCGVGGWGFGRRGYPVNIAQGPTQYRPPKPPIAGGPGPVKVHPLPVTVGGVHGRPISPGLARDGIVRNGLARGPQTIAGQTVLPLKPVGNGFTQRGGSATGASLRRDFPVDAVSGRPVRGVPSGTAPVVPSESLGVLGWRTVGPGGGRPPQAGGGAGGVPPVGAPGGGRPVMRPLPPGQSWPTVRPGPGASVPARPGLPVGQGRPIGQPIRPVMPAPAQRSVPAMPGPRPAAPIAPAAAPHR